ncbi:MAG: NusG domain II-containing protein [Firmicutes bacterium]|nr:NusG domain II-containing protein [Bacillota bacterium]
MKKNDWILIGTLFLFGILLFSGFKLAETIRSTGYVYAKVFYKDTLVLMIDLHTDEFIVYDTEYANQIDVGRASEGIFYVPGSISQDMTELYTQDSYALEHQIQGIKLLVEDGKIRVVYQESPKDLCELQPPTNSSLEPLVCLPNELVVNIYTNLSSEEFVPDAVLE